VDHVVLIKYITANSTNSFSQWNQVVNDIPRDPILGPSLCLIYVNDIQELCHSGSDVYLYADDSKLLRFIPEEYDSFAIQSDLNSLKDWFKKCLLKLNINKCNVVYWL